MRELDPKFYATWSERFRAASANMDEIKKRKDELPNAIDDAMEEVLSSIAEPRRRVSSSSLPPLP